ncbi:28S ribosomal protein S23 [Apis cerana cerana]|uniref:Small ribosomal subunit protein mS23 n=1 Tax=Apis cerana cerana TaxID=94128 RepID=A0A2A3E2R0_APICC|nr:28S ribosomal protein S23 [Apis cerana cerana]
MAQSRTEKIGTIFTRITALVRSDVLDPSNLPLWYNIYKSFPPKDEPIFARKPSQKKIQDIFYAEDIIRAMSVRKAFSLVFIRKSTEILLGLKKRGFGKDKWNGFGGKIEPGESILHGAMRRKYVLYIIS